MKDAHRAGAARMDRIGMVLLSLAVTGAYLWAYRHHPSHPHVGGDRGWWNWFDQSWYLSAAKGWAVLDLDPARHLYLPGYALLAAPFVGLLSVHAFAIPNLACLLVSLWLFSGLAVRLLPATLPCPRLIGGAVFAAATLASPSMRDVWVVPWSTTGSVPFVYAALLGALRFVERPDRPAPVFWVGFAGGCIAGFRPADAIPVLLASGVGIGLALILGRSGLRAILRSLLAGASGLGCAIVLVAVPYVAIYGLHESHYVAASGLIGFEWRFLPLHWVLLGLDPRPLVDDGSGLVEAFPWLPLGIAACLIHVVAPPRPAGRLIHLTVAIAACLHIAIYLCYRDLYPEGFFRYWNYHYYKWVMPVMALYALILVHDLATGPRRAVTASLVLAAMAILLPWRAELGRITPLPHRPGPDPIHQLDFTSGLHSIRDVVLIAAAGDWNEIYGGTSSLSIGGRVYADRADYKLLPAPGGFLLVPLRPLAEGQARLTVGPDLHLDPTAAPLHARQLLVPGLPCWVPEHEARCETPFLLPPPPLPASGTIRFDGGEAEFLGAGWSGHEPAGRWTDGRVAILRARLAAPPTVPLQLRLTASAYVPAGSNPLTVRLKVGGRDIAGWSFSDGETTTVTAAIPASAIEAPSTLDVELSIDDPRSPAAHVAGSQDDRRLGLFVRTLSFAPGAS